VLVFVMRNAFDGVPITSVFHESDGDWQFRTGDAAPEMASLVHLSHVLARRPDAPGTRAIGRLSHGCAGGLHGLRVLHSTRNP
jgi:hypothetical protein